MLPLTLSLPRTLSKSLNLPQTLKPIHTLRLLKQASLFKLSYAPLKLAVTIVKSKSLRLDRLKVRVLFISIALSFLHLVFSPLKVTIDEHVDRELLHFFYGCILMGTRVGKCVTFFFTSVSVCIVK